MMMMMIINLNLRFILCVNPLAVIRQTVPNIVDLIASQCLHFSEESTNAFLTVGIIVLSAY